MILEAAQRRRGRRAHRGGFGRWLKACKDVGECFESSPFDFQLLRHVLDILWPVRRVLHLDIRVRLSIGFRLMCMSIRVRLGLNMTYLSRLCLRLLLLGLEPTQLVFGLDLAICFDAVRNGRCFYLGGHGAAEWKQRSVAENQARLPTPR